MAAGEDRQPVEALGAVPRAVGNDVALQMLLTGRRVTAEETHTRGLVTELTDDPLAASTALAQQIASMPPEAVRRIKATLRRAATTDYDTVVEELEPQTQAEAIAHPEFAQRVLDWHAAKTNKQSR